MRQPTARVNFNASGVKGLLAIEGREFGLFFWALYISTGPGGLVHRDMAPIISYG